MGKKIRQENGVGIRESIKRGVSKLADEIRRLPMRDIHMSYQGWKVIAIVLLWSYSILVFIVTREINISFVKWVMAVTFIIAITTLF